MLESIAIGGGLAFAAAVQPGPLQAYLLSRVAAVGWRRTLPASLAPLLSDGPIALVALLLLGRLSPAAQAVLRTAGGVLLLYLAARAFSRWQKGDAEPRDGRDKTPRTLLEATLVNVLNPNPYLGWALVLGPVVVAAWRESPARGVAVVAAFYVTMVTMLAATIMVFGSTRLLGERLRPILLLVSALILAALGVYQLAVGVGSFSAGG
jgi:threonine/homoserine/homoserine lactone efflux protein